MWVRHFWEAAASTLAFAVRLDRQQLGSEAEVDQMYVSGLVKDQLHEA